VPLHVYEVMQSLHVARGGTRLAVHRETDHISDLYSNHAHKKPAERPKPSITRYNPSISSAFILFQEVFQARESETEKEKQQK